MHILTVFYVSSPCINYFRRSCGDKNSTKSVADVRTDKGKIICTSPLCGWGIQMKINGNSFHLAWRRPNMPDMGLLVPGVATCRFVSTEPTREHFYEKLIKKKNRIKKKNK